MATQCSLFKRGLRHLVAIGAVASALPMAAAQTGPYVDTAGGTYTTGCAVPNAANPGDLRITINVADNFTVGDVDLGIIVDQGFRLDTELFLTSPSGTTVQLLNGPAPNNAVADYNVRLDQDAAVQVNTGIDAGRDHDANAAPFQFEGANALRPEVAGALDAFDGESATGNWFIDFCDNFDDGPNTVSRVELFFQAAAAPTDADLSLTLTPSTTSPTVGTAVFFDVALTNSGPANATGVSVDFDLPAGFSFQSDDGGGTYNSATGVWTPGTVPSGTTQTLRVIAQTNATGPYSLQAEVLSANEPDPDSTPANAATNPGEDDTDAAILTPVSPPPPLFCLGRPINPLVFTNPVPESPGANLANPQVNDVFRFPGVSPGVDALVRVAAFNNGATLLGIDNDVDGGGAPIGIPDNFQPTLVGPAGDVSVDFEFTFVSTGTNIAGTLDFAGSAIDVDGNGGGLREYIEVSNNIVEFALNGVTPPAPATRLVTQANTPPDPAASAPSAADRIRFEAATDDTAAGIDPDEPRNIAAAFFTDVSVFEYRIGKFGDATAGRLNSLAFNCPNIDPGGNTGGTLTDEDFGDAPFDVDPAVTPNYGNPIHVIEAGIQLGPTNTAETAPGDSPTASSDAGDDGVTLPAEFQGGTAVTFDVDARGAGGYLQVFIDWNIDGDFEDAGEQPIVDLGDNDANDATPIAVTITPPASTVAGTSFARFRWSRASGVGIQDPAGDGEVEDYQVTLLATPPVELLATKTTQVFDPNGDGLFAVPGNDVTYTITVNNSGLGDVDDDSLFLIDELPPEITFFNGDADGPGPGTDPVNFAELVTTGLDPFVFATDVGFSDAATAPADFAACNYTPIAGFDPAVTFICFNPKGVFLAGDPDPSFSVSFRARIR